MKARTFALLGLIVATALLVPGGAWSTTTRAVSFALLAPERQAVFETIYLDMFESGNDGAAGPVSSTNTLTAGEHFRITISGTVSFWRASQWSSVCKGVPEDWPQVPSPSTTNGKVGVDPAFVFAVPEGSPLLCDIPESPPIPSWTRRGRLEISLDNGGSWFVAVPTHPRYDSAHVYTYVMEGQGAPVQFRWVDNPTSDNYGILTIQIEGPVPVSFISNIEINQALGQQYSDPPKFVAGKDTAIRVFLSAPVRVSPATQQVVVKRNGSTVTTLAPIRSTQPSSVLTFLCPIRSACGDWQAGDYTFDVTVNGLSDQATATFQQSGSRRMLAVPVKVKDRGVGKGLPDDQWKMAAEFLRQVYPIASDSVDWELGPELDATRLDLTNLTGQNRLWFRLWRRQPLLCGKPFRPPCYDHIIGFIPPMPICDSSGCLEGWTKPPPFPPVSIVMANGTYTRTVGHSQVRRNIDNMQSTIAHEVGHNYRLGDEYDDMCGVFQCNINPPPPSYRGQRPWLPLPFLCNYTCGSSKARPWPGPGTGSMALGDQDYPFEVNGRQALGNMLSFMGTGELQSNYWITPRIYDQLFDQLSPSVQTALDSQQPTDVVQAFGWIGQDNSVTVEPWYHFTTTLGTPTTGTYTIESVDAVSQTLASQGFEVSFLELSNPPREIDPAFFEAMVAFPAGTQAFHIKHNDTVLCVVPVSPNKPTITVTEPTSGQIVSGIYTTTWQSNDLDGDPLYHTVEYSHDGQDWLTLASVITETWLATDFDTLPGGSQARIRVTVSDGINTAEATSAAFVVGNKPPEVFIESPSPGARYVWGTNVTLYGSAYDLQDGWLRSDAALVWSSDLDGVLGSGEVLNLHSLSAGQHTITLSATNSLGLTATADVVVTISNWLYIPITLRNF